MAQGLIIPWQDVQAVGDLETANAQAPTPSHPRAIEVVVTNDFYERYIAPKRRFLAPPGAEPMFRPKGA